MELAPRTTLRLGGPAGRLVEAATETDVVAAVRAADAAKEPLLVLAGGSNVVVADAGFGGAVVVIATKGVERTDEDGRALALDDPQGERLQRLARAGGTDPGPMVHASGLFGSLASDVEWVRELAAALELLAGEGVRGALAATLSHPRAAVAA